MKKYRWAKPLFVSLSIIIPLTIIVVMLANDMGALFNSWESQETKPDWRYVFLVLFTDGWKGIGWSSIVYIAAINAISPEYYEASRLDGAGKLSQIWYITLPLIKNVIVTMLIMRICYIMDAGFDQIYTMHNAGKARTQWHRREADSYDHFTYTHVHSLHGHFSRDASHGKTAD